MKRHIVTAKNPDWMVGYTESRKSEADEWQRDLHSDWVVSLPIERDSCGRRVREEQFPIPTPICEGALVGVLEPGVLPMRMWEEYWRPVYTKRESVG